jgi:hypothetical protein
LDIAVAASGHNNKAYASCPLSGHASLEVRPGSIRIDGRRERPVLTVLGAGVFGVAALAAVIAV